ncbi:MAG: glycosyltransferase [Methylococcaceae bacterium]
MNFVNEHNKDVLLHIALRAKDGKVVLNSCINNHWANENNAYIGDINGTFRLDLDSKTARLMNKGNFIVDFELPYPIPETGLDNIETYGPVQVFLCTKKEFPLHEVLFATGFEEALWLIAFNSDEYEQLNPHLQGRFSTCAQALEHFLTVGIEEGCFYSDREIFNADFYRSYYEDVEELNVADAYRHWIKTGKQQGRNCSEVMFLKTFGVDFSTLPKSFDAETYLSSLSENKSDFRTPWHLFKHWIESTEKSKSDLIPLRDSPEAVHVLTLLGDHKLSQGKHKSATKLYANALAFGGDGVYTVRALVHLGNIYLRGSYFSFAVNAYQKAIQLGSSNVFVFINMAKAYSKLGLYSRAMEVISKACDLFPESTFAHFASREIRNAAFFKSRQIAIDFALQDDKAAAYRVSNESVIQYLNDMPKANAVNRIRRKASTKPRVLIMGTADLAQCLHYRVRQKMEHLRSAGFEAEFVSQNEPEKFISMASYYDAAIFYRVPAFPGIVEAIAYARQLGMTTFYEIDDLIFDPDYFPDDITSYGGLLKPEEYANLVVDVPLFEQAMAMCDYGIASTPSLQKIIAAKVKKAKCFLHRNAFGELHERIAKTFRPLSNEAKDTIDIFYGSGTKAHNEDFDAYAAPAIADIMQKNAKVRLTIAGYLSLPTVLSSFEDRIICIPPIWDLETYWTKIVAAVDINIAVLKPGLVSDCKSEIKWLEAAMLGVPSIVSSTATYRDLLEDGQTGMIAASIEEWQQKLAALVNDTELRKKIARQAWELSRQNYSITAQAENISSIVLNATPELQQSAQRPLILIVNVFFPPQTIGGATRVVHDNVDYFIDHFGEQFDLAVFTSIDGELEPYQLRCYDYRGVCVTAVSTPKRKRGHWQAFDDEMEAVFTDFLERSQPDLIHFHCMQHLTASLVSAARKKRTPYYITAHDAWWISDYQFMVDKSGKLRMDHSPIDIFKHEDKFAIDGFFRLQKLKTELAGAQAILSVSESFEAVYRQHGVHNTRTIGNGVSHLPKVKKRPHPDHRIRLGLIGGMQAHKGLPLVKRALLSTSFDNLHLTVVDLAESYSQFARHELYGSTPVDVIGKLPQERIGELYSRLDVLLAVSIWPESYGLVTREALACGLWVIASDRGAIGADVIEGENGFVVDVSGTPALIEVLKAIDANPEFYRSSPSHKPKLRSADSQAKELAALYLDTLKNIQ